MGFIMKEVTKFKVSATSKDGHGYILEIESELDTLTETFNSYLESIGWGHFQYRITSYMMVADMVIVDDRI